MHVTDWHHTYLTKAPSSSKTSQRHSRHICPTFAGMSVRSRSARRLIVIGTSSRSCVHTTSCIKIQHGDSQPNLSHFKSELRHFYQIKAIDALYANSKQGAVSLPISAGKSSSQSYALQIHNVYTRALGVCHVERTF